MTTPNAKPRAGEHVNLSPQDAKQGSALREIMQKVFNLEAADKENEAAIDILVAERDALVAQNRELVEALQELMESIGSEGSKPSVAYSVHHFNTHAQKEPFFNARRKARAILAKHGR